MPNLSNLAEDVALVFEGLNGGNANQQGSTYLAERLGVADWSPEFFEIRSAIFQATKQLRGLIEAKTIREPVKSRTLSHIDTLELAFGHTAMINQWQSAGARHVRSEHTDPILALSSSLHDYDYEKPTEEERVEFRADAEELLAWLREHQLEEHDFIRACLIDGVERFIFRLDHLNWTGWGYAVASLRDVIGAYLVLERGIDPQTAPTGAAALLKVVAKLAKPFELIAKARDKKDDIAFVLEAYKATAPLVTPALGYVAGLLTTS